MLFDKDNISWTELLFRYWWFFGGGMAIFMKIVYDLLKDKATNTEQEDGTVRTEPAAIVRIICLLLMVCGLPFCLYFVFGGKNGW